MRRTALLLGLTCAGLAAILLIAWQTYTVSRASIEATTFDRLTSLRAAKRKEIRRYLDGCAAQVELLAQAPAAIRAVTEFGRSFESLPRGPGDAADVTAFYERDYAPRAVNGDRDAFAAALVPDDPGALAAQAAFLARNPHPLGEKDRLADSGAGSAYDAAHGEFHAGFRRVIETLGFYDLFLIAPDGRIVYTVCKEIDFGTSLETGPHSGSNLAEAFRLARGAGPGEAARIVDYERYAPSYRAPAAFVAAPVRSGQTLLGVVAAQLPVDRINSVMTGDDRWHEDGLGESGETYLVGTDLLMRSDSRFILEFPDRFLARLRTDPGATNASQIESYSTTILFQRVETDGARAAIEGESGTRIIDDYRGTPVLSSYAPLRVRGLEWAILSEIDAAEAFAPVVALRERVFLLSGFVALVFVGLAGGLSVAISRNESLSRERERVRRDLVIARDIQHGLLPGDAPSLRGYDVAGWSRPADETGGDYFDWQLLESGRFAFSLADVTGHGIGPALVTAVCRAYARASFSQSEDLGPMLDRINRLLHDDLPEGRFVTLVVGLLDLGTHTIDLLSAGHGPICVYRAATGEVSLSDAHDIPIGVLGDRSFGPGDEITLDPGDILVLLTDGFFEWAAAGGEMFGINRLGASVERASALDADGIIASIRDDVLAHAAGSPQLDDLTAIVIKRERE